MFILIVQIASYFSTNIFCLGWGLLFLHLFLFVCFTLSFRSSICTMPQRRSVSMLLQFSYQHSIATCYLMLVSLVEGGRGDIFCCSDYTLVSGRPCVLGSWGCDLLWTLAFPPFLVLYSGYIPASPFRVEGCFLFPSRAAVGLYQYLKMIMFVACPNLQNQSFVPYGR